MKIVKNYTNSELTKLILYYDGAKLRFGAQLQDSKLVQIKLIWYNFFEMF